MPQVIDYEKLPERLRGGMRRYIEDRIKPGGFLCAVITNDLKGAFIQADPEMRVAMAEIVMWMYWEAPAPCCGSQSQMDAWLAQAPVNAE